MRTPLKAGIAGAIAAAGLLAASTAGEAVAASCTPIPQTIRVRQLVVSGKKLRVHAGAVVYAVIVEPQKYAAPADPSVFPWVTPTASGHGVLRSVHLCADTGMSTLARTVTAFRASHAGTSTVSAALAPAWRAVAGRPHAFRATVTVVG